MITKQELEYLKNFYLVSEKTYIHLAPTNVLRRALNTTVAHLMGFDNRQQPARHKRLLVDMGYIDDSETVVTPKGKRYMEKAELKNKTKVKKNC